MAGMTGECVAKSQPEVFAVLDALDNALDMLDSTIDTHESRVSPVLRDPVPQQAPDSMPGAQTIVSGRIARALERVLAYQGRIADLTARIEV